MKALLEGVLGGLVFSLFIMVFVLIRRFAVHAFDYERSCPKNLGKQWKFVWSKIFHDDRRLFVISFFSTWLFFAITIFSIAIDSAWVGKLVELINSVPLDSN